MGELRRIEQLMAHLQRQLARGGLSYEETVDIDDLISILAHVRATIIEDIRSGRTPPVPETPLDAFLKSRGT